MQAAKAITLSCTMLNGTGKVGDITPLDDGYYKVVVGAYNAFNSQGMFYDINSVKHFFGETSPLMRQISKGVLIGEWKHPERSSDMSDNDYIARLRVCDIDRESHTFRNITLEPGRDERGRPVYLVVAELKPSGPYGSYLKEKLENKHQNVYFSVRSLTMDDLMRGIKYTRELITWDCVGEGGIYVANKYMSPGIESFVEVDISQSTLLELERRQQARGKLGLEDHDTFDYRALLNEAGWGTQAPTDIPAIYNGW